MSFHVKEQAIIHNDRDTGRRVLALHGNQKKASNPCCDSQHAAAFKPKQKEIPCSYASLRSLNA